MTDRLLLVALVVAVATLGAVIVLGIPAAFPTPESRPTDPATEPGSGAQSPVTALPAFPAPVVPADPSAAI